MIYLNNLFSNIEVKSAKTSINKKSHSGFPNKYFNSLDEYYDFAVSRNTFGADAYKLKKELDKKSYIPVPKIKLKNGN